ncbi:MAG: competence/damage-inducible protein A [Candidatus Eremiobacterota bacterium]
MVRAEILAVGSELLTPFRSDTNSLWLTARLNELGIEVQAKAVASDELPLLEALLEESLGRAELVITSGGLGPTEDDRTRDAVSGVTGRELVLDEGVLGDLRARFERRGLPMAENNRRQALIPAGARVLPNPRGTAPGMALELDGKRLFVLPGPPRELQPMFLEHVLPSLGQAGMPLRRRTLKVNGLGESALDEILAPLYRHLDNPSVTILFTDYDIEVHLTARAATAEEAEQQLEDLAGRMCLALGHRVYSSRGESLPEVVIARLRERGLRLAAAESCTGGMLAERITAVSGASDVFDGSLVTYTAATKTALLGVDPELIRAHTVYSPQVAEAMARGARERAATDLALSVTGLAGPSGGTPETPVGTVFLGLAGPDGVKSRRVDLPGDRNLIRCRATQAALDWLRLSYLQAAESSSR